ncbi:hypothetical protein [Solimonas variicoloris]|uniref:hypothetical protein n=1 Tax=Solimonas variicoloris TaxID=254408 RepID=UPI0012B55510|nr:hypothetical protein [Solimonas variicoloris]
MLNHPGKTKARIIRSRAAPEREIDHAAPAASAATSAASQFQAKATTLCRL